MAILILNNLSYFDDAETIIYHLKISLAETEYYYQLGNGDAALFAWQSSVLFLQQLTILINGWEV